MSVAEMALDYHTNGFFPLALKGKTLIRRKVTGNYKKNLSRDSLSKIPATNNLGLRLPQNVLGIDWDAYKGAEAFLSLIELLGDLPATYRSTARTDGMSGIYLYTVPFGAKFVGEIKDANVDLIQHTHRYATVFPSIHPDTNAQYNWYFGAPGCDSFEIDIPKVSTLPELPSRWLQFLTMMAEVRSNKEGQRYQGSKLASFSARIEEFAQMTSGNRNNVMKDLARDGMWYEMGGRLEDGQSMNMILDAAELNGLITEDTLSTITYRVMFSRTWAEKHFDATKVGNPEGAQFDEQSLKNWNNSVQASDLSDEVKFAASTMVSFAIEKKFGYIIMSTRLLAELTGVSAMTASRYMKKLAAKGWIKLTAGQGYNKEGKTLRSNEVRFLMDQVTVELDEAPILLDISYTVDAYVATRNEVPLIELTSEPVDDIMIEEAQHNRC